MKSSITTAANDADSYTRYDDISDAGLAHFQTADPTKRDCDTITKEALFYYIYDLRHSRDYRSRYADILGKELSRIPSVKRLADFLAFSQADRDLAHWHLNYETVVPYAGVTLDTGKHAFKSLKPEDYRVEKMKFAKTRDPETNKSINDKTTVFFSAHITLRDIPEAAYAYIVNGKPALEWVMERQSVSKDNVQRHHQRRQPLGHRDAGQSQVSAGAFPSGGHHQPRDDEDREWAAES